MLSSLLLVVAFAVHSCVQTETEVPVQGITLNRNDAELTVGDVLQLTATVTPSDATDKTITWSSSVVSVATVDSKGKVTAVGVGKAIIIAKAGTVLAPCTVVVSPAKVPVSAIQLDAESITLTVGGQMTLTATVVPADASCQSVEWSSSATEVATVSESGVVTALSPGNAVITASADGVDASCQVTVKAAAAIAGIYIAGKDAYEFNPKEQQISIYSAEGNNWYRFLLPSTLTMYQVGPIPESVSEGDTVSVVLETFTSGVETAGPVSYTLEIQSMDGVLMTLVSANGDVFKLRY